MAAFLEEYHSVNQPPGAVYPTDGCHTSTHMGPKAELWIFFSNPHIGFFSLYFKLFLVLEQILLEKSVSTYHLTPQSKALQENTSRKCLYIFRVF